LQASTNTFRLALSVMNLVSTFIMLPVKKCPAPVLQDHPRSRLDHHMFFATLRTGAVN
jgi:hypothetical protein